MSMLIEAGLHVRVARDDNGNLTPALAVWNLEANKQIGEIHPLEPCGYSAWYVTDADHMDSAGEHQTIGDAIREVRNRRTQVLSAWMRARNLGGDAA